MVTVSNSTEVYPSLSDFTSGLVTFSDKYAAGDWAFGLLLFSLLVLFGVVTFMLIHSYRRRPQKISYSQPPAQKTKSRSQRIKSKFQKKQSPAPAKKSPTGSNIYDPSVLDWLNKK